MLMTNKQIGKSVERVQMDREKLRKSFLKLITDEAKKKASNPNNDLQENEELKSLNLKRSNTDISGVVRRYKIIGIKALSQKPKNININIAINEQKIKNHPYYLELLKDESFVSANKKFIKKLKLDHNFDYDQLRFISIIAKFIGFQFLVDSINFQPVYADAKLLKQTLGHIKNLQDSFNQGINLNNRVSQVALVELLDQLKKEIELAPRKERATATSEKRKCIETVALEMLREFEISSATILSDLAAMINWQPDHSTIDKLVKTTKEKHKKDHEKSQDYKL